MTVLSVDDQSVTGSDPRQYRNASQAELLTSEGDVVLARVIDSPIIEGPSKYSIWALGGMFALLGAAVVTRRPDLGSARLFGIFAGSTALAFGVAPASGGPGPQWALMLQFLTVAGVGATFFPFVANLSVVT